MGARQSIGRERVIGERVSNRERVLRERDDEANSNKGDTVSRRVEKTSVGRGVEKASVGGRVEKASVGGRVGKASLGGRVEKARVGGREERKEKLNQIIRNFKLGLLDLYLLHAFL